MWIPIATRLPRLATAALLATSLLAGAIAVPAAGAKDEPDIGAAGSDHGIGAIHLNPGGGNQVDGSDGLRLQVLESDGGEHHYYRGQSQYYSDNVTAMLNIGGQLFTEDAVSGTVWDDIELVSSTGSATNTLPSTATGSGSIVLRYSAVRNTLTYTMLRTISYTYPNDFYTQTFEVTIPAGNSELVKLYYGGDTAPGGSDSGYGIMLTDPVHAVISLNQSSLVQLGIREAAGSAPFDGATAISYSAPYPDVRAGNDIGFLVTESNHDAGLMTQWTLGSDPGTYPRSSEAFANVQGVTLTASFRDTTIASGDDGLLDLNLVNTNLTASDGLGYSFQLPAGLVVGATGSSNSCGGTLTAVPGGSSISLSGGSVLATSNCLASVPVTPAAAGAYVVGAASVTSATGVLNGVGTSALTVTGAAQALSWGDDSIATPIQGRPFADAVTAVGYPPATYSVTAGTLPAGLSLDANTGGIVGTPTTLGPYAVTVTAANGSGPDISAQLTGAVVAPAAPAWTDVTIASFFTAVAYSEGVQASGQPAPTYAVSAGALPTGINLDPATGALAGVVVDPPGTPFDFTISASNGVGSPVSQRFTYEIQGYVPPSWTDEQVAAATVGTPYVDGVAGDNADTYAVTAGSLPPGLSLDGSTGDMSGTPTATGSFGFTVTASNPGSSIDLALTLEVTGSPEEPKQSGYTCPRTPFVITDTNRRGAEIAWYVCRMHLVGGDWQGRAELVLLPRGWFGCPATPYRHWYQPGNEFGGWLIQHHCGYRPLMARAWFGPWFAWDPPPVNAWWERLWAATRESF